MASAFGAPVPSCCCFPPSVCHLFGVGGDAVLVRCVCVCVCVFSLLLSALQPLALLLSFFGASLWCCLLWFFCGVARLPSLCAYCLSLAWFCGCSLFWCVLASEFSFFSLPPVCLRLSPRYLPRPLWLGLPRLWSFGLFYVSPGVLCFSFVLLFYPRYCNHI